MKRIIFILSLVSGSLINSAFCEIPQILLDKTSKIEFNNALYFADVDNKYSVYQVSTPDFLTNFKPLPKDPKTYINSADVFWLRFDIVNQEEMDLYWIFEFNHWSYLNFYSKHGEVGGFEEYVSGNLLPFNERSYPRQNNVLILKHLAANESNAVFVRLEINRNYEYLPSDLSFNIYERAVFDYNNSTLRQATSVFMTVYLVMFLYNLFIYFFTKEKIYIYYLGVLMTFMYLSSSYGGYLISFFSFLDFLPKIKVYLDSLATGCITFFSIQFARGFLNLHTRYPSWNRLFTYTIWLAFIIPIVTLFNFDLAIAISNPISFFFIICIVIVTIKSIKEKYPSSIYLMIAITFSVLGTFISILASMNIVPQNDFTVVYSLPLGSNLEAILFSLALANKIDVFRREKEISQRKALAISLENQRIVKNQNIILEKKVLERTEEITKQKEIIQDQKEKADELLLNILPLEIASELKLNGFAKARSHLEATVLFTDFKGFTKLAEQIDIQELHNDLDYCFKAFDSIVDKYGVEKIKTIGDSYMCACGIPSPNKDHAELVIKVGLEMRDFVDHWKKEKALNGQEAWEVRIGIHSGPLISGVIGKKKFAYDIWGNTVNISSRMESSGEPGKVNISESTYELVKDKFDFTPRGKIDAKNLGEVSMYFVN